MKFVGSILLLIPTVVSLAIAQYPDVTVRQIQEVPIDSLLLLDTLQCNPPRWTLQASPYYGDTVSLTALCVVPARVLDYTASGFNLLLADTSNTAAWGGILVRTNTTDTSQIIQWGILNVHSGDIIRLVGYVDEFSAPSCASVTQIVPILTIPLQIIGTAPVPPYRRVRIADFSLGGIPVGQVRYSTGERYEFMSVVVGNVFVFARESDNCILGLVDSVGNVMYTYKARQSLQCPSYSIGAKLDSVRGFMLSTSGTEQRRGYRIAITDTTDFVVADVEESERTGTIHSYRLSQSYPNPFNPGTTISFTIPTKSFVTLTVFDLLGREVSTLVSEELMPGSYSRRWIGEGLTSGVYFYQLRAGTFIQTNKFVLLR